MALNRNLFIVVATGQEVSNLPPILQYANKGDMALWLISKEAEIGNWSKISKELLENKYEIKNFDCKVEDLYSPKAVCQSITNFVKGIKTDLQPFNVNFILNGGPKLTPLGLFGAGELLKKNSLNIQYLHGSDIPCFLRVYQELGVETDPKIEEYSFERMLSLKDILVLKNAKCISSEFKTWTYGCKPNYESMCEDISKFYTKLEQGPDQIGPEFEKIVFKRVIKFFEINHCFKKILKEVVFQVKICDEISRLPRTELDVAIVLLNGTVISLECKSGSSKLENLNSKILTLERSTSRVGKMVVIIPYLPESSNFLKQKNNKQELDKLGVHYICYTPPEDYKETDPISFEEGLSKLLRKYLPYVE